MESAWRPYCGLTLALWLKLCSRLSWPFIHLLNMISLVNCWSFSDKSSVKKEPENYLISRYFHLFLRLNFSYFYISLVKEQRMCLVFFYVKSFYWFSVHVYIYLSSDYCRLLLDIVRHYFCVCVCVLREFLISVSIFFWYRVFACSSNHTCHRFLLYWNISTFSLVCFLFF